jgi:hypothetical protein
MHYHQSVKLTAIVFDNMVDSHLTAILRALLHPALHAGQKFIVFHPFSFIFFKM